jgi:hypothetical protein
VVELHKLPALDSRRQVAGTRVERTLLAPQEAACLRAFPQEVLHREKVPLEIVHRAQHTPDAPEEPHKRAVAAHHRVDPVAGVNRRVAQVVADSALAHNQAERHREDNRLEDNRLDCLDPEEERHLSSFVQAI